MVAKWMIAAAGAALVSVAAVVIGQAREGARVERMRVSLSEGQSGPAGGSVDFASFSELPPPVARYFRHVLTDGQRPVKAARLRQSGVLRTGTDSEGWSRFTASQFVAPRATGFLWDARVEMPLAAHVRVLDSYISGIGAGRVTLLSSFAIASEAGTPELGSGALHRYLAEAVWFPTALLPQSGVEWRALDERSALATLTDRGTTVSLEFRFNEVGEITGMYSAGRFRRINGEYRKVPWQGHVRDYQVRAGMRVPLYGEVGWYDDGTLQLVWKGHIIDARYEFES